MIITLLLLITLSHILIQVNAINFSFPMTSMYTCSSHCKTLNMQCVEFSEYSCVDAAKIVTHRKNLYDMNLVKTDCSTGAGCYVDRFSLMYSEIVLPQGANATEDTCNQVPVCTDIHGGSLKNMHLLCGCKPLETQSITSQLGLSVELSTFQLVGITALLLCAAGLLLFLLRKCCSATLFLRYRELEDEEEVMEHFLQKDLTLSTRMAWCLCYEPCIALFSACPVIVQECPTLLERMVDRIIDLFDCFSLLSGGQKGDEDEDSDDEEDDDVSTDAFMKRDRERERVDMYAEEDSDDSDHSEDSEGDVEAPRRSRVNPNTATNSNNNNTGRFKGAYTTAKKGGYNASSKSNTTSRNYSTSNSNNNNQYRHSNNNNNGRSNIEMSRHSDQRSGQSSNAALARGTGARGGSNAATGRHTQQSHRRQGQSRGNYSDSDSDSGSGSSLSSSSISGSDSGSSGSSSDFSD